MAWRADVEQRPPPAGARIGGGGGSAVTITARAVDDLVAAALAAYPCEAGGLLGATSEGTVTASLPLPNEHPGLRLRVYACSAAQYAGGLDELAADQLAPAGWFHSHPLGRPQPSAYDRQALPRGLHVIVAVSAAGDVALGGWYIGDDREATEVRLVVGR